MTSNNEKKLKELAKYLEVPVSEIQIEDEDSKDKYNRYLTANGSYYVMDEDEAYEAAKEDIENTFDDLGIEAFTPSFQEHILSDFIDDDFFEDCCLEDYENYCSDIEDESDDEFGSRLIREAIEHGVISEREVVDGQYTGKKDLISELAQKMYDEVGENYESYAEWYKDNFGNDDLALVIKQRNFQDIDMDALVDACIEEDGYGHFISRYDGKTVNLETFYAFLVDNVDERN